MKIYKITYKLDLYFDNSFNDTEKSSDMVFANTMDEAIIKLKKYVAKNWHNFKAYKEKSEEDGKMVTNIYQYKNFSVESCELLIEADI